MGERKGRLTKEASAHVHMTKKCPECFAYLPLSVKVCTSCGKPVGPVGKTGLRTSWLAPPSWRSSFLCGGVFSPTNI